MKGGFGNNSSPYEDRSTQQSQQHRRYNDNSDNFTPKFSPPKGFPNNKDPQYDISDEGYEEIQKARPNYSSNKANTNDEYGGNRFGQQQGNKSTRGQADYNQPAKSTQPTNKRHTKYEEEEEDQDDDEIRKEEEDDEDNVDDGDAPRQNTSALQNNRSFDSKLGASTQGMPNYIPYYPQQYYGLPQPYMPYGYYPNPLQPTPDANMQLPGPQFVDPKSFAENNEIHALRAKVNELNQIIDRERDTNKVMNLSYRSQNSFFLQKLEKKCKEYVGQLERSAKNFEGMLFYIKNPRYIHFLEEFKQRMLDEKNAHQEEIDILEGRIQDLRGRVCE